ncbi:glycosyltransferase [Georgenia sp. TF02-10]|uniref:glycosyltransferase n=1 Tax=Georgenia sp. TF02-10 TaxID=2917725 RepID=UPI001FA75ED8|nr:glycosyltransferase [Georgenia sp. TF02-10]UNX55755.1 glycosyltransferase [Georgenia sp. TF02-10]
MRIAVVGPTHPYKGGIAQHTTRLAHELARAGHDVYLESWSRQYPAAMYPGQLTVPDDQPEIPVFPRVLRRLAWYSPWSWWAAGRRLRRAEVVIVVVASTVQVLPYLVLLAALGGRAHVVGLMHNVLPHEARPGDRALVRAFLGRVDQVLVHSPEQAALAASLTTTPTTTAVLPANLGLPPTPPRRRTSTEEPLRVLAFGLVRPYKGVDLLVRAAAAVPQVRLTVAGEFWTPEQELWDLARAVGVEDRLTVRNGYVPTADLPDLFGAADLVALTYRAATGSGNIKLAFEAGRPVVATPVGTLAEEVRGRYGVVADSADPADIAAALRRACDPGEYDRLAGNVQRYPREDYLREWADYVGTIDGMLGRRRAAR